MIWFVIAVVLIVAGAVMVVLSRSGPAPAERAQDPPENLFDP